MLFTWKDITLLFISFLLVFLINYVTICTCYIVFYFSKKFETNLLKNINNKIKLINDKLKIKKNEKKYELTKDLLIITFCIVGIMLLLLAYIIYMNLDLFKNVYNQIGHYIIFNLLLFMIFNVPFYLYIIYYTSNYIKLDLVKVLNN